MEEHCYLWRCPIGLAFSLQQVVASKQSFALPFHQIKLYLPKQVTKDSMVQLVALVASSLAEAMAECLTQRYFVDAKVNILKRLDSYTEH